MDMYEELSGYVAGLLKGYRGESLGLQVAHFGSRNLLFAKATGSAVKEAEAIIGQPAEVVEVGLGTGINAVAALLAGAGIVYGYEKDEEAIDFARGLAAHYGVLDKLVIVEGDYLSADLSGIRADVIVNENLSQFMRYEPQLAAANKFLQASHEYTRYVPLKVEFELLSEGFDGPQYLGAMEFDRYFEDVFTLSRQINWKSGEHVVALQARVYGHDRNPMSDGEIFGINIGGCYLVDIKPGMHQFRIDWYSQPEEMEKSGFLKVGLKEYQGS